MVGEFVILPDISNICHWANILLVTVVCIPLVLLALVGKLIPRRGSELFKLEWKDDYFERGFLSIRKRERDPDQRTPVEDSSREDLLPSLGNRQDIDTSKQVT